MGTPPQSEGDPVADRIVALHQLEPLAERIIDPAAWDYVAGGAGDEDTLRCNVSAWANLALSPHVLVDASRITTNTTLFGKELPHPILLAPTATHARYHRSGEVATLQGAAKADTVAVMSSLGSTPLNTISQAASAANTGWYFQLYIQRDRGWTRELVDQAVALGAQALVVTVDTPTLGARDRDKRDNLGAATATTYPILDGAPIAQDSTPVHRRIYNPHLSPDITWRDLEWLVEVSPIPVVPKGILRADDANRATELGVGGIVVSNHGARNLDTAPATAVALPAVVDTVAGRVPLIVDGGIRRGTDIAKALAMGARAVMIGRPYIWGLAVYGPAGVTHVVEILRTELEMAMALLGTPTISDLTRDALWQPSA